MAINVNDSITFFTDYLDRTAEDIIINAGGKLLTGKTFDETEVTDEYYIRKDISDSLKLEREDWDKRPEIFCCFETLVRLMNETTLSIVEQKDIIFYLIKRNLYFLGRDVVYKSLDSSIIDKVGTFDFKYLTKKEVSEMINNVSWQEFINRDFDQISEDEQNKIEELLEFFEQNKFDSSEVDELHQNIKEHYFDKNGEYEEEDLLVISDSLRKLNLSTSYVKDIVSLIKGDNVDFLIFKYEAIFFFDNLMKDLRTGNLDGFKDFDMHMTSAHLTGALLTWLFNEKEATESNSIFNAFNIFDAYISTSKCSKMGIVDILLYIIKRNIDAGILRENTFVYEKRDVGFGDFLELTQLNPTNFDINNYFDSFSLVYKRMCMKKAQNEKALKIIFREEAFNLDKYRHAHQVIKEHYFDKIDSYDSLDIAKIADAFEELELSKKYIGLIRAMLDKIAMKRRKAQSAVIASSPVKSEEKEEDEKESLSQKEYNQLYRELMTYFDFNQMEATKPLTLKDVLYCVRLLRKLGYDDNAIKLFLIKVEKYNKTKEIDIVDHYLNIRAKLEYYSIDNEEMAMILEDLDLEYQKYFNADKGDEKTKPSVAAIEAKQTIADDMEMALQLLPRDFEYELNEGIKKISA